jgi:hypothetical protein
MFCNNSAAQQFKCSERLRGAGDEFKVSAAADLSRYRKFTKTRLQLTIAAMGDRSRIYTHFYTKSKQRKLSICDRQIENPKHNVTESLPKLDYS